MNEPQNGDEFVTCDRCGEVVEKDQAEPAEVIATKESVWVCNECCAVEDYDPRSLDLFDA